jgi:serine protease Do
MRRILPLLLGVCVFSSAPVLAQDIPRVTPQSQAQVSLSFAPLVQKVAPAVVNIYTSRTITRRAHPFMNDPFFQQFFGDAFPHSGPYPEDGLTRQKVENALGSGVIVDADGVVITNVHVVDGADEIRVVLSDGREFPARVSVRDEPSDIAVLRVDAGGVKLPFAPLRASETAQVGDLVLAIGNPFGVGQTVTSGIISALARSSLNINDFNFFIQTDAAINPGNSGGPLVAMDGGVIGINTAIYSRDGGSLGIGFAVPSEMVMSVMDAEENAVDGSRSVVRPWLGITAQNVTADIAESLGLDRPAGVLVAKLHTASPLHKAGVKAGDLIVAVNGHTIADPSEMKYRMATTKIGGKADMTILRQGKTRDVKVAAIAPPDEPARKKQLIKGENPLSGATLVNMNPAVVAELGFGDASDDHAGVVVIGVEERSIATRFVRPGDKVIEVNGVVIGNTDDAKQALARAGRGGVWAITLERNGRQQQIVIR